MNSDFVKKQGLEPGLKLWCSFEGDLGHRFLVNWVYIERVCFPVDVIVVLKGIKDAFLLNELILLDQRVSPNFPWSLSMWTPYRRVLPQGNEPMHRVVFIA